MSAQDSRWNIIQHILLAVLCILPVLLPHRANWLIWSAPSAPNIWYEFSGIVFYLLDIPLLLFTTLSLISLLIFSAIRKQWLKSARSIITQHGGFWWVLLLIWMLVSIVWSLTPAIGIYRIIRSLLGLYIALWIAHFVYHGAAVTLLRSTVIAGVLHASVAILQVLYRMPLGWTWLGEYQPNLANPWGFGFQELQGYGLSIHPNNLAGFLLITFFACLALMRHNWMRTGWMAWLEYAALGIIIAGVMATGSRTAIIALGIGIISSSLLMPPQILLNRTRFLLLAISLTIAVVLLAIATSLASRFIMLIGENFTTRFTFAFADTVAIIHQYPLLGVGHGNLMLRIAEARTGSPDLLLPAHNILYIIRAELGLVGVALFTGGIITILNRLRPKNASGIIIWGCCFIALIPIMLLDFYLWSELRSHYLVWLCLGFWWGYNLLHHISD